jgi:hypothetical protein
VPTPGVGARAPGGGCARRTWNGARRGGSAPKDKEQGLPYPCVYNGNQRAGGGACSWGKVRPHEMERGSWSSKGPKRAEGRGTHAPACITGNKAHVSEPGLQGCRWRSAESLGLPARAAAAPTPPTPLIAIRLACGSAIGIMMASHRQPSLEAGRDIMQSRVIMSKLWIPLLLGPGGP